MQSSGPGMASCAATPSGGIGLIGVIGAVTVSVATAWGLYLIIKTKKEADALRATLEAERQLREVERVTERARAQTERQGRIRAEQQLRGLLLAAADASGGLLPCAPPPAQASPRQQRRTQGVGSASGGARITAPAAAVSGSGGGSAGAPGMRAFPLHPIGTMQSCFSQRNGTPRQPLLAPLARCRLKLAPDVPAACLEGLELYSHVWVLYIFHENTDLVKVWQGDRSGLKAKVHVPRLNGEKMGVLATRSPHRPAPIGLSVAQ
ncbi:hypothetical protein FOA52_012182, partial [Chlamydomonas sp. UWO 241]